MSPPAARRLVLDANILIRCVLGSRARELVLTHLDEVAFFTPRECFKDARRYLRDETQSTFRCPLLPCSERLLSATSMSERAVTPEHCLPWHSPPRRLLGQWCATPITEPMALVSDAGKPRGVATARRRSALHPRGRAGSGGP